MTKYLKLADTNKVDNDNLHQAGQISMQPTALVPGESSVSAPIASDDPPQDKNNGLEKSKKMLVIGVILVAIAILFVAAVPTALNMIKKRDTVSTVPPQTSATDPGFSLVASGLEVALGSQLIVSVVVTSEKDNANLFVARIKFPAEYLEVENINLKPQKDEGVVADWYVANWVENSFDNTTGSISLVGGIPSPGVKTPEGQGGVPIAEVTFNAKKLGEGALTFDDTSSIYRDSDNANILKVKKELPIKVADLVPITPSLSSSKRGDINQDGAADLADLSVLLSRFGLTKGEERADMNQDSIVNAIDFSSLVKILIEEKVIDSSNSAAKGS